MILSGRGSDGLHTSTAQAEGECMHNLGNFVLDNTGLTALLRDVVSTQESVVGYVIDLPVPLRVTRKMKIEVSPIARESAGVLLVWLELEDVTTFMHRAATEGEGAPGKADTPGDPS